MEDDFGWDYRLLSLFVLIFLTVPYAAFCWFIAPFFLLFMLVFSIVIRDAPGVMLTWLLLVLSSPFRFVFDRIYEVVLGRQHEWKFLK